MHYTNVCAGHRKATWGGNVVIYACTVSRSRGWIKVSKCFRVTQLNIIHLRILVSGNSVRPHLFQLSCLSGSRVRLWFPESSNLSRLRDKVSNAHVGRDGGGRGGAMPGWPAATRWRRCIYRWLYQLIGGLQHVESTQAHKLQRKDSAVLWDFGFNLVPERGDPSRCHIWPVGIYCCNPRF